MISMRRVEIEEAFVVKAIGAGERDVEGNIERDKVAFLHELGRSVLHSDLIGRAVEVRALRYSIKPIEEQQPVCASNHGLLTGCTHFSK
jgi:hypothetical protein